MIGWIIKIVIGIILLALLVGWYRTYRTQHSANQKLFLTGTLPSPSPDGFYNGTVAGYDGSWRGKTFDASAGTGKNIFDDNGSIAKYPFTFYAAKGLRDKTTEVIRIDYSNKTNPMHVRWVTDEIVQTAPDKFLGKIHFRPFGLVNVTVGWFTLEK